MRRIRPAAASLIGLGLGVAGCDTVSTSSISGGGPHPSTPLLPHDVALVVLVLSLATLSLLATSIARRAVGHHRLAGRLRGVARSTIVDGRPVGLVPGRRIALVAGIRRPATFLSEDVVADLTDAELAAVVLHEQHHELRRAPAALIALQGVAGILGWVRPIAHWSERARACMEIAADAHAMSSGSSRHAIAGAIVKLADPPSSATVAGFGSAADLRLRALLAREPLPSRPWSEDVVIVVGLAAAVVVVCSALTV
jgi:hypothetical protein